MGSAVVIVSLLLQLDCVDEQVGGNEDQVVSRLVSLKVLGSELELLDAEDAVRREKYLMKREPHALL